MLAVNEVHTERVQTAPWSLVLPPHWSTMRLKDLVWINRETLPENFDPDHEIQYIDIGNVNINGLEAKPERMRFEDSPSRARRIVRPHDTIVSTVRTYLKAVAYFESPPANLIASTGFAVLSPKEDVYPKYLYYLVRSPFFINMVTAHSVGVSYPAVNSSVLASLPAWLPSAAEQRAIAAYLDHRTDQIDALIAEKRRLIELLREKRNALISHAVTKGLDPDVPMKESGVEWIGEVPEDWEVVQLKRLADISYGLSLQLDRTATNGVPILSVPNVSKSGELDLDDVPVAPLTKEEKDKFLVQKDDLLFNWRNGSADHVGKTAYFDAEGQYAHVSFLLRLRFRSGQTDSRFYHRYLNYLRHTGFFTSTKAMVNNTFNQTELQQLWVAVPPLDEQKVIAESIAAETRSLMDAIHETGNSIEKLLEYRKAFISAAVTGKIDVREWQEAETEEMDEPDRLEQEVI